MFGWRRAVMTHASASLQRLYPHSPPPPAQRSRWDTKHDKRPIKSASKEGRGTGGGAKSVTSHLAAAGPIIGGSELGMPLPRNGGAASGFGRVNSAPTLGPREGPDCRKHSLRLVPLSLKGHGASTFYELPQIHPKRKGTTFGPWRSQVGVPSRFPEYGPATPLYMTPLPSPRVYKLTSSPSFIMRPQSPHACLDRSLPHQWTPDSLTTVLQRKSYDARAWPDDSRPLTRRGSFSASPSCPSTRTSSRRNSFQPDPTKVDVSHEAHTSITRAPSPVPTGEN